MEESTYETFEDELGTPLQENPPAKPVRQIRRTDMQITRKLKEEPPSPQNVPKPAQREMSRTMSIRQALSIQSARQAESPWEGVTLNRCLFLAIAVLLITSGIQRLHEALRSLRAGEDCGRVEEGGERLEDRPALRRTALKRDRSPAQPEGSLWHSLFQWVLDDEDDEDEEDDGGVGRRKRKTETAMKSARGRAKDPAGSTARKREQRKERMGRGREQEEEEEEEEEDGAMGKRERREMVKQREEEERPRKKQKKSEGQKRSEVTEVTE